MSTTRGAWGGNDIVEEHIEVLRHRRKIPSARLVAACFSGPDNSLILKEGEVVVFAEHFARGLGLPMSEFFFGFLMHYGLQPHHLVPNAVLQLAAFVILYEGFLGIERRPDLWRRLFFFK
ncbi:hypothetical protein D1007_41619 [Hordeum vulgare]|nr:hypothetical protein D1007_41619 [Hordeum vulgare]